MQSYFLQFLKCRVSKQKSAKHAYDGFAAAFPCEVQKDSKYPSYSCDSGRWISSIDIDVNVSYTSDSLTKEFMEQKFQRLFDSTMVPGAFTYSTLQGYPTVSAEATRKRNGQIILIGKVMYVFVKARRRIYIVSAFSFPSTLEATAAERKIFMESFELLDGFSVEKYISREFGFSVSFPSEAVSVDKDRNKTFFTSWNVDKTWWGDVYVLDSVPYETGPVNKMFVDRWFNGLFSGAMNYTGAFIYSTLQGYPTVSAKVTKRRYPDGQVLTGRMSQRFCQRTQTDLCR